LTKSDEIVLFDEEEGPGFQPLHIQGRLTRVLFMIRSGDVIAKLVWVVPEARCSDLDKIVFSWVRMWEAAAFGGRFPPIEYRSENGSYLGSLGTSRNARHRSGPKSAMSLTSNSEDGRVYALRPEMIIQSGISSPSLTRRVRVLLPERTLDIPALKEMSRYSGSYNQIALEPLDPDVSKLRLL